MVVKKENNSVVVKKGNHSEDEKGNNLVLWEANIKKLGKGVKKGNSSKDEKGAVQPQEEGSDSAEVENRNLWGIEKESSFVAENVRLRKESILRFTIEAVLWKRKMFEDYTRRRKKLWKKVLVPLV